MREYVLGKWGNRMNLLITGAWSSASEYIDTIEKQGHKVCFLQYEKEKLPCAYEWAEGVICNGLFLSHPIEKFVNLQYIQLTSAGFDRVPMEYIKAHDIEIHNARGVYSIPMAEFAVAGVLQLYKKAAFFHENQKKRRWEKHRGLLELFGKTVCIVGCGSVGTECAKRFKAFGCRVIGINRTIRDNQEFEKIYGLSALDTVLPEIDVLILTVSATEQTRHLINEERLKRLKPMAVIVNIARGEIIDTTALLKVLDKMGGAVLDVFEEEPLDENSPLWKMENIIVTPHNSFVGEKNNIRLVEVIIGNISKYKEVSV